jgi:hypothetical protein
MSVQVDNQFVPETDEFAIENVDARPAGATDDVVKQGWAFDKDSTAVKEYAKDFKISETPQLVKFIGSENGPIKYKQHFLDQKTQGQRSYTCLEAVCPLCIRLKSPAEKKFLFSIALLTKEDTVFTRLVATPKFFSALLSAEHNPNTGPLLKNYWALSRFGKMQQTTYTVTPVKGRDLMEDYGIDEAKAEAAIAEMKPYDASSVRRFSVEELNEIVDALI